MTDQDKPPHTVIVVMSPTHRIASCSCGWVATESRRGQNAWAAAAKLKKAIRQHGEAAKEVDDD